MDGDSIARKIKNAVRDRDGQKCVQCGMTAEEHRAKRGRTLSVHRLNPGEPYEADRCVTLCEQCHASKPKSAPWGLIGMLATRWLPPDLALAVREYALQQEESEQEKAAAWVDSHTDQLAPHMRRKRQSSNSRE